MKSKEIIPIVNNVLSQYDFKLTVRQIYYRLISDPYSLFDNNRNNYTGFDRILTRAREEGLIDWTRIEDRTRQSLGGEGHIEEETPEEFMQSYLWTFKNCYNYYDKKMWTSQQNFIEVWVEKDALSSLVAQVCDKYRVLTFPSRGYSSFTKVKEGIGRLHKNTEIISEKPGEPITNKPTYVLHLTDLDPSGLGMTQDLKKRLLKYQADFIKVRRIGLDISQVTKFNLRPNPVKQADTRTADYVQVYGSDCWELDALPPDELQKIITREIKKYIDKKAWKDTEEEIEKGKEEIKDRIEEITESFDEEE